MDLWGPAARHLIAPLWATWERTPYLRDYRDLLRRQYDAPEVMRRNQWNKITGLIQHAYGTTPFWKNRFDEASIRPGRLESVEQFQRVPLLTKEDLRSHGSEMVSHSSGEKDRIRIATSGSTGVAVEVYVNEALLQWRRACVLRSDEWSGWRLGERVAVLWGRDSYVRKDWRGRLRNGLLERRRLLDTLHLNEQRMEEFADSLRRKPASLLFGHAHSLYLFAKFLESRGGAAIRPRGIISTAMVLHDWERRTIESVFHCAVTNRYGCEEVGLIACECEVHQGLHINADGIYVEVIRKDGTPAEPGELGAVVITDLCNRTMPIIRYLVGDMAVLAKQPCSCGRTLPLIEEIGGRVADYVVTPRGEMVSGISLTDHFNCLVPGVVQMQIIQEAVDRLHFNIVKSQDFGIPGMEKLRSLVDETFGPGIVYDCEFVEKIPQEPSGKFRFCISKVSKDFAVPDAQRAKS
jgi:phenylacetate-CoA ligase